jgi:hypothetical protein
MKSQVSSLKPQVLILSIFLFSACSSAPILDGARQSLASTETTQAAPLQPLPAAANRATSDTAQSSVQSDGVARLSPQSSALSLRSAQITWDPSLEPDLKRYLVKRSDNAPTAEIVIADITTTPTFSFTVENPGFDAPVIKNGKICGLTDAQLDPARTYYYSVFAMDVSGNISLPAAFDSSGARLRVRFTPLNPPTGVRVFAIYP